MSTDQEIPEREKKRNYLGFTPTLILIGMYGLVYARAINEHFLFTIVGRYTNFDASPIPFLRNDDYLYQNVYLGVNFTFFPFSKQMFPKGFYFGFDLVPSLGFVKDRDTDARGMDISFSGDILIGYSWLMRNTLKLSTDIFLNFNPPGINIYGENF